LAFGGEPEELPFDLRHRRGAITYSLMEIDDPSVEEKRTALVKELAAALKTNLAAPREDRMIKNPQPVLSLEASEEMPAVALIEQNATLECVIRGSWTRVSREGGQLFRAKLDVRSAATRGF
jgi:hypothetical protein